MLGDEAAGGSGSDFSSGKGIGLALGVICEADMVANLLARRAPALQSLKYGAQSAVRYKVGGRGEQTAAGWQRVAIVCKSARLRKNRALRTADRGLQFGGSPARD